jgi:transmembrane sensor
MPHPKIDFAALRERTVTPDEGRAQAIQGRVVARYTRHVARIRIARFAGVAAPLAALAAVLLLWVHRQPPAAPGSMAVGDRPAGLSGGTPEPPGLPAETARPRASTAGVASDDFGGIVLADGSRVTFLVAGTQLAQSGTKGRQSTLVRGAARFDVVHDAETPFRVTAGRVVVEDVGTVFTIRLADEGRASVAVESGSVSVRGPDGERTLEAGASEAFPAVSASPASPAVPHPPSWKKLAQAGDYDRAYAIIQSPGTTVRDDPEELLLAADAARLSGHAERAVPPLRRIVSRYPGDSRAGLAAFTLGRVLLDDLGRPEEAAAAFTKAYDRGGPLAEDALAREVEAWSRAGNRPAAARAATKYLSAFPTGRHAALVHRLAEEP